MKIGLTGGMGCGKSTALTFFKKRGAVVIETDALVRVLLETDTRLRDEIVEAFGTAVLNAEGNIDRALLSRRVFGDPRALELLETFIHPRVRNQWMAQLREAHPILVVEIPLLFENGLEKHFDKTVCVSASAEVQKQRCLARGISESQLTQRLNRQLSLEEKMRRADITLHNNGSVEHLEEQIEWILSCLVPASA